MVDANLQKKFFAKIVLLGDLNVGKTTLINKFTTGEANNNTTVGGGFKTKNMTIKSTAVTVQIWDTAGQEKFNSIGFAFYRSSNCCVLAFDVSNQQSFDRLSFWKSNFISEGSPANPSQFPFVVVGNKTDQARVVSREAAEEWCRNNGGYQYFETCATTGEGVDAMFTHTGTLALEQAKTAGGDDDVGMPTSLSGASGAIKIDRQTEAVAEEEKKKKKKKCKC